MTSPKRVFVLGAGFTKAYLPKAPVITDDYDSNGMLTRKFEKFPYAKRLLELERCREGENINLERLMSRLDAGMPYDEAKAGRPELEHLLYELKKAFLDKFLGLKIDPDSSTALIRFAAFCISTRAHCITFNYDDLFDWALLHTDEFHPGKTLPWVCRTGYGFTCEPSESVRPMDSRITGPDPVYLLKLHGSFNWRIRAGHHPPYVPESIVHHGTWYGHKAPWIAEVQPQGFLERLPFIVPPVMTKDAILKEPVLRTVWTRAYEVLELADEIVFLGYSLPTTDLAARFLFGEAIRLDALVTVVMRSRDPEKQKRTRESYEEILGKKRLNVAESKAREWIDALMGTWQP
jgi:hypothetical protein